ncbi:unnamed protein product, partial [Durusdinium trenchii]
GRQQRRHQRRYQRGTTSTTTWPGVMELMKALEKSRGALHSTWSTVADSLAGSEAQLVRDLNEKWFSVSGTFSLVTEFVISYKANATYTGNNAGLKSGLDIIVAGLSNSGSSLLQAATFSVSKNLAERCRYLSSYADPVFGEGNIYEMLTELQAVCSNTNVAAALPAAAEPNAAALIEGVTVLETGTAPTTTLTTTTTTPPATTSTTAPTTTITAKATTTAATSTTTPTTIRMTTTTTTSPTTTTTPTSTSTSTTSAAATTSSGGVDKNWALGPGGGSCDDVCGVGLCDLTKQESVTSDELMAISTSLGRQCASVHSYPNPYSPEIDSSQTCWRASGKTTCSADTTDIRHQRICYCTAAAMPASTATATTIQPQRRLQPQQQQLGRPRLQQRHATTSMLPTTGWQFSVPGQPCDTVCGVDKCDKDAMAGVNDQASAFAVMRDILGKPCNESQGRNYPGSPFWAQTDPFVCYYYNGENPAGIDCSSNKFHSHEALCYCLSSNLIQDRFSSETGFQRLDVDPASSPIEPVIWSAMVHFSSTEATCDPNECFEVYTFGGCLSDGAATNSVHRGVVNLANLMVLWAKSGPAPVNLALHTVVWMGPDSALVFGGLDSCNEGSVATNKLWQWSRNVSDGGWKELSPLPYLCGLYFHTANTIVSLSQSGMVVYGGLDCNNTVSTDHFYLFDFQTLKWTQKYSGYTPPMFGHATAWTPSNPTLLFVQGGYQWDWVSSVWSLESDLYVLDISTIFIPGSKEVPLQTRTGTGARKTFHSLLPFKEEYGETEYVTYKAIGGIYEWTEDGGVQFQKTETYDYDPNRLEKIDVDDIEVAKEFYGYGQAVNDLFLHLDSYV